MMSGLVRSALRQAVDGAGRNAIGVHVHDRFLAEAEIDVPGEGYLGEDHGRGDAKTDGDRELQHHQRGARSGRRPACPRC